MKSSARISLTASIILLLAGQVLSQEPGRAGSLGRETQNLKMKAGDVGASSGGGSDDSAAPAPRYSRSATLLKMRIEASSEHPSLSEGMMGGAKKETAEASLKRLKAEQESLEGAADTPAPSAVARVSHIGEMNHAGVPLHGSLFRGPIFRLSHPADGRTDIATGEFFVSWTPAPWATGFTVEINVDETFNAPNKFSAPVTCQTTGGVTSCPSRLKIPKDTLDAGVRYFWRVTADCDPALAACPVGNKVGAANAPYSFSTIRQIGFFDYLSKRGFSLQKVVTGDEEEEGASFAFLKTFGGKTIYTADFALIKDWLERGSGRTRYSTEASVEGHLTSDESEAEDALRFGLMENLVTNLSDTTVAGLHSDLGAKLETDQKFKTKKLFFEANETLTAVKLFMGQYSRNKDIRFRWRPFFAFQAGHTFRRGEAAVPEDTVLRLIPRVHMDFRLDFISRALKIPRTQIFVDDKFYFMPIERDLKRTNYLDSGLEFDFTPNFGLAFNYKNGKSAPKFEHVHTFGASLTIRFGKNEQ
jgi:hypothetical protein